MAGLRIIPEKRSRDFFDVFRSDALPRYVEHGTIKPIIHLLDKGADRSQFCVATEDRSLLGTGVGPKGQAGLRRIPLAGAEHVLGLYKQIYYDLNIRHFHEKLQTEPGLKLTYTWVPLELQGAGLIDAAAHSRKQPAVVRR